MSANVQMITALALAVLTAIVAHKTILHEVGSTQGASVMTIKNKDCDHTDKLQIYRIELRSCPS